jgi:MbtH protein
VKIDPKDDTEYRVGLNDEEQYSIWPAHREIPLDWRELEGPEPMKNVWSTLANCGMTYARSACGRPWRRMRRSGKPGEMRE